MHAEAEVEAEEDGEAEPDGVAATLIDCVTERRKQFNQFNDLGHLVKAAGDKL